MSITEHHVVFDRLTATARSGESLGSGIDAAIHSWLNVFVDAKDEASAQMQQEVTELVDLFF